MYACEQLQRRVEGKSRQMGGRDIEMTILLDGGCADQMARSNVHKQPTQSHSVWTMYNCCSIVPVTNAHNNTLFSVIPLAVMQALLTMHGVGKQVSVFEVSLHCRQTFNASH